MAAVRKAGRRDAADISETKYADSHSRLLSGCAELSWIETRRTVGRRIRTSRVRLVTLLLLLPAPASRLAGFDERIGHRRPAELRSDLPRPRLSEPSCKGAVTQEANDGVRKGVRLVGDEDLRPMDNRQALDADGRRHDGLF